MDSTAESGPSAHISRPEVLSRLKLLALFFYILGGGLTLLVGFPILAFLLEVVSGVILYRRGEIATFLAFIAIPVLILSAGWYLEQSKKYAFCAFVCGFSAWIIPFGSILGIVTIIQLARRDVMEQFAQEGEGLANPFKAFGLGVATFVILGAVCGLLANQFPADYAGAGMLEPPPP